MSDWQRADDLVFGGRQATEEEVATRDFILDAAEAWAKGELPLEQARELTGGANGRDRFTATRFSRGDPRFKTMLRFIDALIAASGGVQTNQGFISTAELHEGDARKTIEDGREIIQFAAGYEKSTGRPFYRSKEQRGPNYRQFRPGGQPKAEPKEPEKKWETGGESE